MQKKYKISFFCPAYNDEENLPILIPKINTLLNKTCSNYEIVIIDDCSPDNTGKVADELSSKFPNVKVIHHKQNKGYGGALLSGFKYANKYPLIFFTDGDNQYDVNVLLKMLPFTEKYDVITGFRGFRNLSLIRKIQSIVYNRLVLFLFKLNVKDINCALRLFKRDAIKNIKLNSKSAFLPAQILIELAKHNNTIKEIEVKHYPRIHGKASGGKPSVVLSTFYDLIINYFKK